MGLVVHSSHLSFLCNILESQEKYKKRQDAPLLETKNRRNTLKRI